MKKDLYLTEKQINLIAHVLKSLVKIDFNISNETFDKWNRLEKVTIKIPKTKLNIQIRK